MKRKREEIYSLVVLLKISQQKYHNLGKCHKTLYNKACTQGLPIS